MKRLLLAIAVLGLWPAGALAAPAAVTTPANELLLLDTDAPGTVLERHAITGLQPTEGIRGIDVRPATGRLYGLGIVPGAQDTGRIYVIDPGTGAATQVGTTPFSTTLTPSEYGFDFNPFSDRIRVVNRGEDNLRVNADDGTLLMNDTPLTPSGDVDGIAYDQNVAGTSQTTLWGYDSGVDRVVRIGGVNGVGASSANNGQVTFVGAASGVSTSGRAGMDIAPGGAVFLTAAVGATHSLFRVDLGAGTLTALGNFSEPVDDFARLQGSAFIIDDRFVTVTEDTATANVTVLRLGNASGTQTVSYATTDGDSDGNDYLAATGALTFGPGETSKTFTVGIKNDTADEPNEFLNFALSSPTGGSALGTPSTGTVTIVDDDGAPVVVPPDTVKPQVLLSAPSSLLATTFGRGVKGRFSCSEQCTTRFTLRLGKSAIGAGGAGLNAAGARRFTVRPSKRGRKALRRALRSKSRRAVTLRASATDPAGNVGTASARITVRRR